MERISKEAELNFLRGFIQESCFDEEISRDWLRMLWTAYCLHQNLDVDTAAYDRDIGDLWKLMQETGDGTSEWDGFDEFDSFMARYLV